VTRTHDARIVLGDAELFVFLCVNKALRVLTVTKETLRDGFSTVAVCHMAGRGWIRSVAPVVLNRCTRWKGVISFNTTDVSNTGEGSSQNLLSRRVGVPTAGVYVLEKRKRFAPKMKTSLMYGIQQMFRTFFRNVNTNIENCSFCAIMQQVVVIYRRTKTNMMHCLFSVYFVNQPLHVSGIFVAHHQEVHCIYTTIGTFFISVFNQLDAQNLFHNKFYFMPLHVSSTCAYHHEVKIILHSLWFHNTFRWPSRAQVERGPARDGHLKM